MIFINEWLPNPVGNDAKGEFIELFNSGSVPVSLAGWKLKASGKKVFVLKGQRIMGNGYLVLPRSETKLTLKNVDEQLFLYDAMGKLVDQSAFEGTAQEGKSWSRIDYKDDHDLVQNFAWSNPTPGAVNKVTVSLQITNNEYPTNQPLNRSSLSIFMVIVVAFFFAMAFAAIIFYAVKQYDDLSELFFGRDKTIG